MSQHLHDFIKDPLSLSYSPGIELTNKMPYRAIIQDRTKPILNDIALAVAFNAMQTGLFLIPFGIIAVCTLPHEEHHLKKMLGRSASFLFGFLIITLLLNPFYWKAHLPAIIISYQTRTHLLDL